MKKNNKRGSGFWILICTGILLNIVYLLGQTMAIISYDFPVSLGLQEHPDAISELGVAMNKGFGFGDTLIYIPLFIIGIVGMFKRTQLGYFTMFGALAITAYWPVVSLSTVYYAKGTPGWNFTNYASYTILLTLIALYGIWGMWHILRSKHSKTNQ